MEKFKRVYIEISNICNLQCSFCPEVVRPKEIMSAELFEKTIKEVAPLTEQVCLHLMGEPLAHPQFETILDLCEKYEVKINLTTNGLLLNRHADLLLRSRALFQINFSVHSFKDNFKDKNIAPYLESLLNFSQRARELRPLLYINFRLWNLKDKQTQNDTNADIIGAVGDFFGVQINSSIDTGSIKSKKIIDRLYLHFDTRFEWPHPDLPKRSESGFCHALSSQIGIHANGQVVPCCLDKEARLALGNCQDKTIGEILNSERAQRMLQGFRAKKLAEDLCQRCPYIARFQ